MLRSELEYICSALRPGDEFVLDGLVPLEDNATAEGDDCIRVVVTDLVVVTVVPADAVTVPITMRVARKATTMSVATMTLEDIASPLDLFLRNLFFATDAGTIFRFTNSSYKAINQIRAEDHSKCPQNK